MTIEEDKVMVAKPLGKRERNILLKMNLEEEWELERGQRGPDLNTYVPCYSCSSDGNVMGKNKVSD